MTDDNQNRSKRRHPKQDRALQILRSVHGDDVCDLEYAVPSDRRRVDLLVQMRESPALWGPLGLRLLGRTVAIEIVSGRLSRGDAVGALWKLVTLADERARRAERRRGAPPFDLLMEQPPAAVVVAGAVPRARLDELNLRRLAELPAGISAIEHGVAGDLYVVDLRALPVEPGTHFLHLLAWPDRAERLRATLDGLLGDDGVLESDKGKLMETMMNMPEHLKAESEQWIAYREVKDRGRAEGRAEGEARGRAALLGLLPVDVRLAVGPELEAIADVDALAARVRELLVTER